MSAPCTETSEQEVPITRGTDGRLTFNIVLTGAPRCGASVIWGSTLDYPDLHIHKDLLHPSDRVRERSHASYFGPRDPGIKSTSHCLVSSLEDSNVEHYLTHRIFDHPMGDEKALGVWLEYEQVQRYDLFDYFRTRALDGDFAMILVRRNPFVCYVSLCQARASRLWHREGPHDRKPEPVRLVPSEVYEFMHTQLAVEAKLCRAVQDAYVVDYADLLYRHWAVMAKLWKFLELPSKPFPRPKWDRQPNHTFQQRVVNFAEIKAQAPCALRDYFESSRLI